MRHFYDGDELFIEPWRAKAFPVIKDLVVDRSRRSTGSCRPEVHLGAGRFSAPDANAIPIPKDHAELAMDFAECIGCGACVATCPNGAAMLFVSAKIAHLGILPQGSRRARSVRAGWSQAMETGGFGACTNFRSCEAVCPKEISISGIARMNKDWRRAMLKGAAVRKAENAISNDDGIVQVGSWPNKRPVGSPRAPRRPTKCLQRPQQAPANCSWLPSESRR